MDDINVDDFERWLSHSVTKKYFKRLESMKDSYQSLVLNDSPVPDICQHGKYIGSLRVIEKILDISFQDIK